MTPAPDIQKQYDELVAAIADAQDLSPYMRECHQCHKSMDAVTEDCSCEGTASIIVRAWNLEDVLRAVPSRHCVDNVGWFHNMEELLEDHEHPLAKWHLGHDLAWHRDNAPETILFLHSLLV